MCREHISHVPLKGVLSRIAASLLFDPADIILDRACCTDTLSVKTRFKTLTIKKAFALSHKIELIFVGYTKVKTVNQLLFEAAKMH